jgi:hypothetical protein
MKDKFEDRACVLQKGCWVDFREDVKKVQPELFSIIEQISPGKEYTLIKISYLYGEKITDMGVICVPDGDNNSVRLNSSQISSALKEELGYATTPLILQLSNAAEVFVETGERIIPLNLFSPGDLYGLFEAIEPFTNCPTYPCWSVTSGARSVFLAAKVTDTIGHKKLKAEFGISQSPPQSLSSQWHVFKSIIRSKHTQSFWKTEVLLFTKNWFADRSNDINWLRFQNYLLKKSWIQSRSLRVQSEYSIMWETFSSEIRKKNLKPSSYIIDTVKHLMLLVTSSTPGFYMADKDELVLPSSIIEKAYSNVYGLKEHAAIILQPKVLDKNTSGSSVYYSMAYPTLLDGTPAVRNAPRIIIELREVKALIETLNKILEVYEERIYENLKRAKSEYFHSSYDIFNEVLDTRLIPKIDIEIKNALIKRFKGKIFPKHGLFFRGCIRLTT